MKLALHSVSYAGQWEGQKYLSLEEFIKKAASLGFDGVELMAKRPHASVLDLDKEDRSRVRGLLEEKNIECACIAGYTDFTNGMVSKMIPVTEMQISYVSDLAKLAFDLGGKAVRVFTGYEYPGVPYWQQWDCCIKSLKECSRRAAAYGVTIGIQNHHDIGVDAYSMRELIKEVDEPNCKAMYDAWSPALQGFDLTRSVELISDFVIYTTVADYIKLPRYKYIPELVNYKRQDDIVQAVKMGEGFIDYKTFFKALKAKGFNGYVAYEMCSQLKGGGSEENLDVHAGAFIKYMKEFK
jgi:sugar phosphate isomerase/epimerase